MRKENIFKIIEKTPGISYNEIVREANLSNGVISHYLIKLLDEKKIEKEGIQRGKYFLKNIIKNDRVLITLLRNKTNSGIFRILMEDQDNVITYTNKELSKKLKKSGSTISVSLKILQNHNIIERVIMNKRIKLTDDLGYKIHNKKSWAIFFKKYNL